MMIFSHQEIIILYLELHLIDIFAAQTLDAYYQQIVKNKKVDSKHEIIRA